MTLGKDKADIKIAYIGGGSRGWAWNFMSDLAGEKQLSGTVSLYDIDFPAAKENEHIGNGLKEYAPEADNFRYEAVRTIEEALRGADFVIISILPGTFDEMESDVHAPEKYGIYQSVGDTVGPAGILRGLRTIPMFEGFAHAIRDNCPDAWVINYTNPMTMCVRAMYKAFPQIKAFGCCHEVFGTQHLLADMVKKELGIEGVSRHDIKVNVVGINHFTWLTKAYYKNVDLLPVYRSFCEKQLKPDAEKLAGDGNWLNRFFECGHMVKMDLFLRYGAIAAAGDRHLAEFVPGKWYLKDPDHVKSWGFELTPVKWRKDAQKERREQGARLAAGKERLNVRASGEEGVQQIKAILGLGDIVTNVNLPNVGQLPDLPLGAVVETNARFTSNTVVPVMSGEIPPAVLGLIMPVVMNQETVVEAAFRRDLNMAFTAFIHDPLVTIPMDDARALFHAMIQNTKNYLAEYGV